MRTLWFDPSDVGTAPTVSAELPPEARDSVALGEHVLVRTGETPTQEARVVAVDGPQVTLTVIGRTAAAAEHDEHDQPDSAVIIPVAVGPAGKPATAGRSGAGRRFRRALTRDELATVRARIAAEGATAGVRALWTVLLLAADGITFEEAMATNLVLDREAYAIPAGQARLLLEWLTIFPVDGDAEGLVRSPRWAEQVRELWSVAGPASFEDPAAAGPPYPEDPAPPVG